MPGNRKRLLKIIHICDKRPWKVQITLSPKLHFMNVFLKRDFSELNNKITFNFRKFGEEIDWRVQSV